MKSHSNDELVAAFLAGDQIWELDTGNDGEDDVLIGSKQEVEADLCHHFEFEELPGHWDLTPWAIETHPCVECDRSSPKVDNPLDLSVYREQVVFVDTDGQVRCWACSDQANQ